MNRLFYIIFILILLISCSYDNPQEQKTTPDIVYTLDFSVGSICVKENYAFIGSFIDQTTDGLKVYDVTAPAKPVHVLTNKSLNIYKVLFILENYLFVMTSVGDVTNDGDPFQYLEILDISDINNISSIFSYNIDSTVTDYLVEQNYLYITTKSTLHTFYIKDIKNSVLIHQYQFGYSQYCEIIKYDNKIFLNYSWDWNYLSIYDITSDGVINIMKTIWIPYNNDIIINDDIIYLIGFTGLSKINLQDIYDISDDNYKSSNLINSDEYILNKNLLLYNNYIFIYGDLMWKQLYCYNILNGKYKYFDSDGNFNIINGCIYLGSNVYKNKTNIYKIENILDFVN